MLIALVPLISFGWIGISQGKRMIKEKAASYLINLSKRNADAINQFMIERVNDINLLSSIFDISDPNFEHHISQVKNDPNRHYIDFFILSESGKMIFRDGKGSVDSKILKIARQPGIQWKGIRIQRIFKAVGKENAHPVMMLSKRLANKDERDVFFLYTLIDFRFIDALFKKNNIENTGEVYMVTQGGMFLSTSRLGAQALQSQIPIHTTPAEKSWQPLKPLIIGGKSSCNHSKTSLLSTGLLLRIKICLRY